MLIPHIGGLLERLIVVDAENSIAAYIVVEDEAAGFRPKVSRPSMAHRRIPLEAVQVGGSDAHRDAIQLRFSP